jgi:hypothetical protein
MRSRTARARRLQGPQWTLGGEQGSFVVWVVWSFSPMLWSDYARDQVDDPKSRSGVRGASVAPGVAFF